MLKKHKRVNIQAINNGEQNPFPLPEAVIDYQNNKFQVVTGAGRGGPVRANRAIMKKDDLD